MIDTLAVANALNGAMHVHTADTTTYVGTVSHGAAHVTLGLAHVGLRDAEAQFEGDGDE